MNRILVVDDDIDILTVVGLILNRNNFSVLAISKWEQLFDSIDTFLPDLILLDVDLSGADGRDICRQLKRSKKNSQIPIILFSASSRLAEYSMECMSNGFVSKPFDTPFLLETIRLNIAKAS